MFDRKISGTTTKKRKNHYENKEKKYKVFNIK